MSGGYSVWMTEGISVHNMSQFMLTASDNIINHIIVYPLDVVCIKTSGVVYL